MSLLRSARKALINHFRSPSPSPVPSFPIIASCPSPTCHCSETPKDLDIDYSKPLNGTVAAYNQHLIISTGQADWTSKIENERGNGSPWGAFSGSVKDLMGRGGEFHDPYHHTLISLSSFTPPPSENKAIEALVYPAFKRYVFASSDVNHSVLDSSFRGRDFIRSFLSPTEPPNSPPETSQSTNTEVSSISQPTILICSHNTRDSRCGILGPLLHSEFAKYLDQHHSSISPSFHADSSSGSGSSATTNIGTISHIGGHKWAGNVILYIPPDYRSSSITQEHPLSGMSIWYGRVEPRHVQGIVEETMKKGKVIRELFRGGIDGKGRALRL